MLRVDGLDVFYGDVQALDGVALDVEEGAIVAIVGANGAGKTTLIRAVAGMLPQARGRVIFGGVDISGWPSHRVCDLGVGQVAEGRQVFPTLTVAENLEVGAMLPRARAARGKNRERVLALFPQLAERARQPAGTLSGGEQQMLAIGRCLMGAPKLIMFDEPSLGLAPLVARGVLEAVRELNREGMTCLLVEQNVALSLALASRAYVLENGRVTLAGSGAALLATTACAALTWDSSGKISMRAPQPLHDHPERGDACAQWRQRKGLPQPVEHVGRGRKLDLGERARHGARHVGLRAPGERRRDQGHFAERYRRLDTQCYAAGAHRELQRLRLAL
jgi:branched-chain amino acid transport system ATP-binding protein